MASPCTSPLEIYFTTGLSSQDWTYSYDSKSCCKAGLCLCYRCLTLVGSKKPIAWNNKYIVGLDENYLSQFIDLFRKEGVAEGEASPKLKQHWEKLWHVEQKHMANLQQPHPAAFVFAQCRGLDSSHSIHAPELVKIHTPLLGEKSYSLETVYNQCELAGFYSRTLD